MKRILIFTLICGGMFNTMLLAMEIEEQYEYPRVALWKETVEAGERSELDPEALKWALERYEKAEKKSLPKRKAKDEAIGRLKHQRKEQKVGEVNIRQNELKKHDTAEHIRKRYDKLTKQKRFWTEIVAMLKKSEVTPAVVEWAQSNLQRTTWRLEEVAKAKATL